MFAVIYVAARHVRNEELFAEYPSNICHGIIFVPVNLKVGQLFVHKWDRYSPAM